MGRARVTYRSMVATLGKRRADDTADRYGGEWKLQRQGFKRHRAAQAIDRWQDWITSRDPALQGRVEAFLKSVDKTHLLEG